MASIDKAAIGFTIAITAIAAGLAFSGELAEFEPAAAPAPVERAAPSQQSDPFANLADKVRSDSSMEGEMMEGEMMEGEMMEGEMMEGEMMEDESMYSGPTTHSVQIPTGTSVVGCERTNKCYIAADIIIDAGDTIEWTNDDTAVHTATAGSPANGPTGEFDSSLILSGEAFSYTFDDPGKYDYFCIVHPWMVGSITVN